MFSSTGFIEFVVGSITILGGLVLLLHKFELIRFGKKENYVKNITEAKECPAHKDLAMKLIAVHEQQIVNGTLHMQHLLQLAEGREEFQKVKEAIQTIGENVAVLLDRSNRAERTKLDGLPMG